MFFFFNSSLFTIVGVIVALVVFSSKKQKSEKKLNDEAPVQTIRAQIVGRRFVMSPERVPTNYMTFLAPDGSTLELVVDTQTYNAFREGEIGDLVWQRKRFLGFNPQVLPYDAQYGQGYPDQQMNGYPQQYPQDYSDQTPLY